MTESYDGDEIRAASNEAHQLAAVARSVQRSRLPHRVEKALAWRERVHLGKIALFAVSLFLFILAITLMKDGARGLTPLVQNLLAIDSPANCLGFGWLSAYVIMSGSPIAAAALTFFDAGVVDKLGAFAMITGSRLGASFIVLLLGLPLGITMLQTDTLDAVQLRSGAVLHSLVDVAIAPIARLFVALLPEWAVFLVGLGIILLSFSLCDRCLPQMAVKESHVGQVSRLVYRPAVMLILGALVTMIAMSVSLSLSILVPLSARGFAARERDPLHHGRQHHDFRRHAPGRRAATTRWLRPWFWSRC